MTQDTTEIEKYSKEWFEQNPDVSISEEIHYEEKYLKPIKEIASEVYEIYKEYLDEQNEDEKEIKFIVLHQVVINMSPATSLYAFFWLFDKEKETLLKIANTGFPVEYMDRYLSLLSYLKAKEQQMIPNKNISELLFESIRYGYIQFKECMDELSKGDQ